MNVRQLKDCLNKLPADMDDAVVILQKDGEGNSYSPLDNVFTATYIPKSTWCGELSDDLDQKLNCIVFVPTN